MLQRIYTIMLVSGIYIIKQYQWVFESVPAAPVSWGCFHLLSGLLRVGRCMSNFSSFCILHCFRLGKDTSSCYVALLHSDKFKKSRSSQPDILGSCQLPSHLGLPCFCSEVTRIFLLLLYCPPIISTWATLVPSEKTGQGPTLTERINSLDQYPDWTRLMVSPLSMNYI